MAGNRVLREVAALLGNANLVASFKYWSRSLIMISSSVSEQSHHLYGVRFTTTIAI